MTSKVKGEGEEGVKKNHEQSSWSPVSTCIIKLKPKPNFHKVIAKSYRWMPANRRLKRFPHLNQGWILCQKIEFWAPHPKKKNKATCGFWAPHPLYFWAPTLFFGPPMAFGALKSTLPPLLNAKLFRFGPLWNDFSDFLLFFLFFCKKNFFLVVRRIVGPPKSQFLADFVF